MSTFGDGGIFISYRREETASYAGRLYDRLADRFSEDQIFIDVDSIKPGGDFIQAVERALVSCSVLLAVIGPHWLAAVNEDGRRRLDNPHDLVRLELEAALKREILVIPVLVDGAALPRSIDLPESLYNLTRRQALRIAHESFRRDFEWLFHAIQQALHEQRRESSGGQEKTGTTSGRQVKLSESRASIEIEAVPPEEWTARVVEKTPHSLGITIHGFWVLV
jgi:TIR domain